MISRKKGLAGLAGGVALAAVAALTVPQMVGQAADHNDPPQRFPVDSDADEPGDIADIFATYTDDTVQYIVTFAGPADPGEDPEYSRNILYRIYTSTDGDARTNENIIEVRFGQDSNGNSGVRFTNVPGQTSPLIGPVEANIRDAGNPDIMVRAGQFDDPFFFDFTGFMETTQTGEIRIQNTVEADDFAGKNVQAFVIEFPRSALGDDDLEGLEMWVQTRRYSPNAS